MEIALSNKNEGFLTFTTYGHNRIITVQNKQVKVVKSSVDFNNPNRVSWAKYLSCSIWFDFNIDLGLHSPDLTHDALQIGEPTKSSMVKKAQEIWNTYDIESLVKSHINEHTTRLFWSNDTRFIDLFCEHFTYRLTALSSTRWYIGKLESMLQTIHAHIILGDNVTLCRDDKNDKLICALINEEILPIYDVVKEGDSRIEKELLNMFDDLQLSNLEKDKIPDYIEKLICNNLGEFTIKK